MIATALAFACAALATAGLALLLPAGGIRRSRTDATGRDASGREGRRSRRASAAMRALATVGRRLAPAARLAVPRELEVRIAAAGLSGPARGALGGLEPRELLAAKIAAAALGGLGGALVGTAAPGRLGVLITVAAPAVAFLAPDLWLARRARERARAIRRELPAMLDLLRVTIEAGLPLTAALAAVGERTRGTLGAEWRAVGREVALGVPLARSLEAMVRRAPGPELRALIGAIERSIRHGAPLTETLAAQARDARAARGRRIREEAARAGPKIQLVVALLLVPSVLLMVAAALVAALADSGGAIPFA